MDRYKVGDEVYVKGHGYVIITDTISGGYEVIGSGDHFEIGHQDILDR